MPKAKSKPSASKQPEFRIRFMKGDEIAIGPGKVALLESIHATGSISAAAKQQGMSYRRAWLLVDTMNRCFKRPLVATITGGLEGGGTSVTSEGTAIIKLYRQMEALATKATLRQIEAIQSRLA